MFAALGRFVVRRRLRILGAWAIALPVAMVLGASVFPRLKAGGFEDPDRESWQTFALLQRELAAGTGDVIALYTTPRGTIDDPEVMGRVLGVVANLERAPGVLAVQSFYATGAPHFVSRDRTRTFLVVDLVGDEQQKTDAYHRLAPLFTVDGLALQMGGLIPTDVAVFETIRDDLTRAELFAFPLTALIVLFVFGSLASVLVMLAIGGSAIVLAFAALRGVVAVTDVSVFAVNTVTILGLGLAVDASLFLVNRFREELPARGVEGAIVRMLETTGRAVAFSGVSVAVSLTGLFVFQQVLLRSLAVGGVVVVLGTVVLALTLVPAILATLGARIDAGRVPGLHRPPGDPSRGENLWHKSARWAMRRPWLCALVVAAGLASLALPFARFQGSIADWRVLPADDAVRATNAVLDREFLPNQSAPHLVLVTVEGPVFQRDTLLRLAALSQRMAAIPGIARVDGPFSFLPFASTGEIVDGMMRLKDDADDPNAKLLRSFAKGSWMRFSLLSSERFDDARSQEQVRALRALSTAGVRVQVAGYAAALSDLREAIRERAPWMVSFVFVAMFVVLFLVFGSVTLPLKAMAMNALSLTASFGAIVWIFQDGRLASLLGFVPLGFSDSTQPLVMFATVFGLSMDYEVLILARVREEWVRTGDNQAAVAEGLGRTGRLITSAAALLVVVVGAFATSDVLYMKALGVGMALAIAIDATIVRALLVPATMRLLGDWNWWAPAPLVRLWKRVGLSDH